MKHNQTTAGLGAPAIIAIVAILAVGGIVTGQLLSTSSDQPEPTTVESEGADGAAGTMMADDPRLDTLTDEELAAGGGATPPPELNTDENEVENVAVMAETPGSYEAYTPEKLVLAETGDVILFFHADWCPSCRALESDIEANLSAIPDGVHILKVDYDNETDLKQQYGIVRQHTLVQVNSNGEEIQTLTGLTNTLAQVVDQI